MSDIISYSYFIPNFLFHLFLGLTDKIERISKEHPGVYFQKHVFGSVNHSYVFTILYTYQ